MTETQLKIIRQIYLMVEGLGGGCNELSLIGSFGSTQTDDDILEMMEAYNKTGSYMAVIASVDDTPEDRRKRIKLIN